MFKIGDNVKAIDGLIIDSEGKGEWAGRIAKIYDNNTCDVVLDALSLDSLSDTYLEKCIGQSKDPLNYIFSFDEIEKSERRDTPIDYEEVEQELGLRLIIIEEKLDAPIHDENVKWVKGFLKSDIFKKQTEIERDNSDYIVSTFLHYMTDFVGLRPDTCNEENINEICLNLVPKRNSSEDEVYEIYGDVVEHFLSFLGTNNYIKNAEELSTYVSLIKHRIPVEAKNPDNWGIAKSMMMDGSAEMIDMGNDDLFSGLSGMSQDRISLPPDPYRGIGRNDKVSVKYTDGAETTDVKFKKVSQDLRDGKCILLEE